MLLIEILYFIMLLVMVLFILNSSTIPFTSVMKSPSEKDQITLGRSEVDGLLFLSGMAHFLLSCMTSHK